MQFVKYFTSNSFRNEDFCDLLWNKMNVRCKPVEDGVILDRDAFNMVRLAEMPVWAQINRKDINSNLHTRPATPDEWPVLAPETKYIMGVMYDLTHVLTMDKADGFEYMKKEANQAAEDNQDDPEFVAAVVIDKRTGQVIYTKR